MSPRGIRLAPEVRSSTLLPTRNYCENRTSVAKAAPAQYIYGTAEAVPFVQSFFPQPVKSAAGTA
jgi:hypothetical protein